MTVEQIAMVCHEANRAYCDTLKDQSQKSWAEAEQWQRDSAIKGVQFRLNNPTAPRSAQHESWMKEKIAEGWGYGEIKNPLEKTHPCIVPYGELPEDQRMKDALFQAIVDSLSTNNPAVIGITIEEYADLKKDQAWLHSLEGAGVDNWDGHEHAVDAFHENYPEYKEAE